MPNDTTVNVIYPLPGVFSGNFLQFKQYCTKRFFQLFAVLAAALIGRQFCDVARKSLFRQGVESYCILYNLERHYVILYNKSE